MASENQENQLTPRKYFKTNIIIYLALLAGPLVYLIFKFPDSINTDLNVEQHLDSQTYIAILLTFGGVIAGYFMYLQLVSKIDLEDALSIKMAKLQTALIMKYALLEGPAFYAFFAYADSNNLYHLFLGLLPIMVMLLYFPTQEKLKIALKPNRAQRQQLDKVDQIIT